MLVDPAQQREQHEAILAAAGLPEPLPAIIADVDQGIRAGALEVDGHDLSTLLGRPTTTLAEALAAAPKRSRTEEGWAAGAQPLLRFLPPIRQT
ncbi:MAG: hypothetical protein ACTHN0_08590 [Aquihabitans sp.]